MSGDPVYSSNGQLVVQDTDLVVRGRGIDIAFTRHYRSWASKYLTLMGDHWCHSYDQKIILQIVPQDPPNYSGPGDAMYFPQGKEPPDEDEHEWTGLNPAVYWNDPGTWGPPDHPNPGAPFWYTDQPMKVQAFYHDGTTSITKYEPSLQGWKPERGAFDILKGTYTAAWVGQIPGGIFVPPSSFSLRLKDGTVKKFALGEPGCAARPWITYRLTSIEDGNHNKVYLSYSQHAIAATCPGVPFFNFYWRLDRVIDTYRRSLDLTYTSGWLSKITDSDGREVLYTHDARANVTVVEGPLTEREPGGTPTRATTRYQYLTGATPTAPEWHYMWKVIAPNEVADGSLTPYVENTYSGPSIVRQHYGGTNASGVIAGGDYDFRYQGAPPAGIDHGWFKEASRTLAIDPNGNVRLDIFDKDSFCRLTYEFTGRFDRSGGPIPMNGISYFVTVSPPLPPTGALNSIPNLTVAPTTAHEPATTAYTTRREYNNDCQVIEEIGTDFHKRYIYDSAAVSLPQRTNLIRSELVNTIDGSTQGVTYAYEPFYNQICAIYSQRGLTPGFVAPNGGAVTPERYQHQFIFDYQEASVSSGATPPVLDLIGLGNRYEPSLHESSAGGAWDHVGSDHRSVAVLAWRREWGRHHQSVWWESHRPLPKRLRLPRSRGLTAVLFGPAHPDLLQVQRLRPIEGGGRSQGELPHIRVPLRAIPWGPRHDGEPAGAAVRHRVLLAGSDDGA
jgi:hypothetical protein